jgi:hypothetical protein
MSFSVRHVIVEPIGGLNARTREVNFNPESGTFGGVVDARRYTPTHTSLDVSRLSEAHESDLPTAGMNALSMGSSTVLSANMRLSGVQL